MLKNKILMALLSAVVAFGLWVYVVTVVSPESETTIYNIPVTLENEVLLEDRGLVLMTKNLPKVTLKLYGNRSDLNQLDDENITLRVDLSKVYEAGEQSLTYTIGYPGDINYSEIQVQSRDPGRISLKFENLIRKEIPVVVNYTGTLAEGYIMDKSAVLLDYEKVSLSGPESAVEPIAQAVIRVDLQDRKESFSEAYRYTLCDAEGNPMDAGQVVTNVAQVSHTMIIQKVKEVPLKVNTVDAAGNPSTNAQLHFEHTTIQVAGSEAALEGLDELVLATVDISKLTGTTSHTMDIVLPSGVTNLTGVSKVTVVIRVKERQTKTFEIGAGQIELLNVPQGMDAKLVNQSIAITIRGTEEQLARMTAADIRIQVDLSGETEKGLVSLKPTVIFSDKVYDVEPLNTPSVSIELVEAPVA